MNEQIVTQAARAQQALTLQQQAELLDLAYDAIFVRDLATSAVRYWNRGAEELYGWTRDEALGQVSHRLLQTQFPQPLTEIEAEMVRTGRWEGELIQTAREGRRIVVASRWALQQHNGEPVAFLEINSNITERKRAEEQLQRRNIENTRLYEEIRAARDQLEAWNRDLEAKVAERTREVERYSKEQEQLAREPTMRILQAQEGERRRIARELHDETVQTLSGLLITLDFLESHIPAGANAVTSGITRARSTATRALGEVRALAHALRPPILDDLGLVAALEGLAEEYALTYGVPITVMVNLDGEERLPSDIEIALFRIAQEALSNACRHSEARAAQLHLSVRDDVVELVVEDDGKGFDLETVARPSHHGGLGLSSMRERAALLQGRLEIDTAPGSGTRLAAVVPFAAPPAALVAGQGRTTGSRRGSGTSTTVVLADDHAMFREGLRTMLETQFELAVIGEAEDGRQTVAMVEELHPDVVVMDIAMPNLNGLDATRQIKRRVPEAEVIILTSHERREYVVQIVEVGASGCVLKRSAGTELLAAIHAVRRGERYISPAIAGMVLEDHQLRIERSGEELLTEREREVLQLVAEGRGNQEIARQLVISVKTVEGHRASIMRKLGAHDRTDLVKYAIRTGMISPG